MEILEKLSNNPLIVSIITILLTTCISLIGFTIKKMMDINKKEKDYSKEVNQNHIVQHFNTGINYSDVEKIAEDVVDRKLSKMKKQ